MLQIYSQRLQWVFFWDTLYIVIDIDLTGYANKANETDIAIKAVIAITGNSGCKSVYKTFV